MKSIFKLIILLMLCSPVLAQEMPSDVKEGDPAYDAVKDLVDRGIDVSQGYPDGTFRGSRYTTKYYITYLMAKLALSSRGGEKPVIDVSDVKDEISWLRREVQSLEAMPEGKKDYNLYGSVELRSRFGNLAAYDQYPRSPVGPETTYRLKYTVKKTIADDANIMMNLDTMDGGFNSTTSRGFPVSLFDFEGNATTGIWLENPLKVKVLVGPGSVRHRDTSGIAPVEDCTVYARPRPSFYAGTMLGEYDVTFGYAARAIAADGKVGTNEVNLTVSRKLGVMPLIGTTEASYTARYMCTDFMDPTNGPDDIRGELALNMMPHPNILQKLLIGWSSVYMSSAQYYLDYELYLRNINESGTALGFQFHSVGVDYRLPFEELEFIALNMFDKKIFDGTVDIGLEVAQPLSRDTTMRIKTDWVGDSQWRMGTNVPGASFTQELSFDQKLAKDLTLNAFYRYFYVPSRLNSYLIEVPDYSDLLGLALLYRF